MVGKFEILRCRITRYKEVGRRTLIGSRQNKLLRLGSPGGSAVRVLPPRDNYSVDWLHEFISFAATGSRQSIKKSHPPPLQQQEASQWRILDSSTILILWAIEARRHLSSRPANVSITHDSDISVGCLLPSSLPVNASCLANAANDPTRYWQLL